MRDDKNNPRKPFSFRSRLHSFRHAWRGLRHVIASEHNMQVHLAAAVAVIIAGFYFRLTPREWTSVCLAIGLVLVAEIFNSAIERLADFISPGHHADIGKIKDLAAAGVLVAALTSVVIAALAFWPHFHFLKLF